MLYIKRIQHDGYTEIKTVDENGNFNHWFETENLKGETVKFQENKTTIYAMGWRNVAEFVKEKMKGYKVK